MKPIKKQTSTELLQALVRLHRVETDTLTYMKQRRYITEELVSRGVKLILLDTFIEASKKL